MVATIDIDRRKHQLALHGVLAVCLLLLFTGVSFISAIIPHPSQVLWAFQIQLEQGLVEVTIDALYAIFVGYGLAIVVGIPIGVIMGANRIAEEFFDPYLDALYALPLAAIVPALIIWFGSGFRLRVVGVFLFAIFPIIINTLNGAKDVPAAQLEAAKSFGASRFFLITRVILPHESTYIAAGLRLGLNLAVKGIVVIEIIVAVTGFGRMIHNWGAALQIEGVISVVLVLMGIGIFLTGILYRIEYRVIHWEVAEH